MSSTLVSNPQIDPPVETAPGAPIPKHIAERMATGTAALGVGVFIERGMGFLGNVLAARFGGAGTFGAYSLALTTANNISTYAGGGIGATAARFSGKYPYGGSGYSTLARSLLILSLSSAGIAALGLYAGAHPIALLLRDVRLTHLLRLAAFSAAGIVFLECARGFFVGQRRVVALLLLSLTVGVGMTTVIPFWAAHHSPNRMIVSQGAITTCAVLLCFLLARQLGLLSPRLPAAGRAVAPMLREVWSFGMVQLAGLVGMNLAGWWLTSLVARADTTLVQMSYFAIASQLRNIVGLGPGLLTEGSYAVMGDAAGEVTRTPDQVMAVCTYLSTTAALVLASFGIVFIPWALRLVYGRTYEAAALTTAIGLTIAVVHMGNAPAAARLTIVSIKTTGAINTLWAAFVAIVGTIYLLHSGSAWQAMTIYLAGHLLSAGLTLVALGRKNCLAAGVTQIFALGSGAILLLAALAFLRARHPQSATPLTLVMLALAACGVSRLLVIGKKHRWLPRRAALVGLLTSLFASVRISAAGRGVPR
jgi:O-antigen/teichoic acid export membrane protein